MIRFLKSLHYATNGIIYMIKTQRNFRIQLIVAAVVFTASFFVELSTQEFLWIATSVFLVFILEGVNTFIEAIVDILSPDYNSKVKVVKDVAAGTVLFGSMLTVMIGCIVFGRAIFDLTLMQTVPFGIIVIVIFFLLGLFGGGSK